MRTAAANEANPIKRAELGPAMQAKANELYAAYRNSFPGYTISNFVGQVTEFAAGYPTINLRVKLCDVLETVTLFGDPVALKWVEQGTLLEPFRPVLRELTVGNSVTISGRVRAWDVDRKELCFGSMCGREVLTVSATSLTKQ